MDSCHAGHDFTPENTYVKPDGRRRCRACQRDRNAKSYRRRVADKPAAIKPVRLCTIEGCEQQHYARGWCQRHWSRWRKTGTTEDRVFVPQACSVPDCERDARRNGYCAMHDRRAKANGDPLTVQVILNDPAARFETYVDRSGPIPDYAPDLGPCWIWNGVRHKTLDYGRFSIGHRYVQAHRWSYEHHVGPISEGLQIDHLCRVRPCVRPSHLEPVTGQENLRREAEARRAQRVAVSRY
ncbi:MAG: endonuclease [Marmoricola sp.]|nr:endonuclease [Marmoricola sp.]